jgi:hypothetical protein
MLRNMKEAHWPQTEQQQEEEPEQDQKSNEDRHQPTRIMVDFDRKSYKEYEVDGNTTLLDLMTKIQDEEGPPPEFQISKTYPNRKPSTTKIWNLGLEQGGLIRFELTGLIGGMPPKDVWGSEEKQNEEDDQPESKREREYINNPCSKPDCKRQRSSHEHGPCNICAICRPNYEGHNTNQCTARNYRVQRGKGGSPPNAKRQKAAEDKQIITIVFNHDQTKELDVKSRPATNKSSRKQPDSQEKNQRN